MGVGKQTLKQLSGKCRNCWAECFQLLFIEKSLGNKAKRVGQPALLPPSSSFHRLTLSLGTSTSKELGKFTALEADNLNVELKWLC